MPRYEARRTLPAPVEEVWAVLADPVRWPEWSLKMENRDHSQSKPRIGYFEDDGRTPVTAETRAAVRSAAEALRRAGFEVQPFLPQSLDKARDL